MKLRIKGNSVRLRLTQREVARVGAGEPVVETTQFITGRLDYELCIAPSRSIEARFDGGRIVVRLPSEVALRWVTTDQVGIETDLPVADGQSLHLLIEKDFACLDRRDDDLDAFPHPQACGSVS